MNLRDIKKTKPRPTPYSLGASVNVPDYEGPFGFPMNSVRVWFKGSCQTGRPNHLVCMRHIMDERERYLAAHASNEPNEQGNAA